MSSLHHWLLLGVVAGSFAGSGPAGAVPAPFGPVTLASPFAGDDGAESVEDRWAVVCERPLHPDGPRRCEVMGRHQLRLATETATLLVPVASQDGRPVVTVAGATVPVDVAGHPWPEPWARSWSGELWRVPIGAAAREIVVETRWSIDLPARHGSWVTSPFVARHIALHGPQERDDHRIIVARPARRAPGYTVSATLRAPDDAVVVEDAAPEQQDGSGDGAERAPAWTIASPVAAVRPGGVIVALGAETREGELRMRLGYEVAVATSRTFLALSVESDFDDDVVAALLFEASTDMVVLLPMLSVGVGPVVRLHDDVAVGARALAGLQLAAIGVAVNVDVFFDGAPVDLGVMGRIMF